MLNVSSTPTSTTYNLGHTQKSYHRLPEAMATSILPSVEQHAQKIVSQLFDFIMKQGDGDYIGEAVSQLEHSLQSAHFAVEAGADEETILGALLHDVGRFIPEGDKMPAMIATDETFVGRASHEVTGERYLRQLGFSDKICQLVGAHVMAKRYLTAVDKDYYDGLSQSSKTTLKHQVGESGAQNHAPEPKSRLAHIFRAVSSMTIKSKRYRKTLSWNPNYRFANGTMQQRSRTWRLILSNFTSLWL